MPRLWRLKHERFAQARAAGESRPKAYIAAGYEPKDREAAIAGAKNLQKRPEVRARIEELRKKDLKPITDVRVLAREFTVEAVKVLATIMIDKNEPAASRITAANSLLDRAHGKSAVILSGDKDNPISVIKRVIVEQSGEGGKLIEGHAETDDPPEIEDMRANGSG